MKKTILFYTLHLVLAHSLCAMEEIPLEPVFKFHHKTTVHTNQTTTTSTTQSLEDLVNNVDIELNKHFGNQNSIIKAVTLAAYLPNHILLSIINIAHRYYQNPSDMFIKALFQKNDYFEQAVEYYTSLAYKDIENVTCHTLEAIEHPELDQPTQQLNTLPLAIKKYVMQKAKEMINRSYEKYNAHGDNNITHLDIAETIGLIAVASPNALALWNFNNCKRHILNTEKNPRCISFNNDGSRIAAAYPSQSQNTATIKGWDTQTFSLVFEIQVSTEITYITYMTDTPKNILLGFSKYRNDTHQTMWIINDNIPCYMGAAKISSNQLKLYGQQNAIVTKGNYEAHRGEYYCDKLYVTKKNCHALKLCELAVASAQKRRHLQKIESSQSYAALTEYEKEMITQQMSEKRKKLTEELRKKQPTGTHMKTNLLTSNTLTQTNNGPHTATPQPVYAITQLGNRHIINPLF